MDDLVKRARGAVEGVTPGPWWTDGKYNGREMGCAIIAARTDCGPLPGNPTRGMVAWAPAIMNTQARECEAVARFTAAARDLVPAMADRIEALTAERDELRAWDDHFRAACGYKRDGRPSPECFDEWTGKVFAVEADLQARLDEAEAKLAQAVKIAYEDAKDAAQTGDPYHDRDINEAIDNRARAFLATIQPEGESE